MRKSRVILILAGLSVLALAADSGRFLIVNQPRKSDVIMVLAGDTDRRPAHALELLRQGYAPRLILNVPADAMVFQWSEPELAQKYVAGLPEAQSITVCPIHGLSTKTEAQDASMCLQRAGARNVLLVTSDFHTRRALSTFEKEVPDYAYSVAAAVDANEFGAQWWKHRQWAKVNLDEWLRLGWWELIDRWR
ncbi:MAG: YdcF family protein [Terriglobales bacterium]